MELIPHTTTAATVARVTEIVTWDFTATVLTRLHTVPVVIIIIDHWMDWVIRAVTIITTTTIPDIQDILDHTTILYIQLEVILTTTTNSLDIMDIMDIMDTTATTATPDTMDTMVITTTTQPTNIIITTTTAIVTATPAVTQVAESLDYLTANSTTLTDIINWVHTILIAVFLSKEKNKKKKHESINSKKKNSLTHRLETLYSFSIHKSTFLENDEM